MDDSFLSTLPLTANVGLHRKYNLKKVDITMTKNISLWPLKTVV